RVCFSGSMNETFSGFEKNTESITVFNNWTPGIDQYCDAISTRLDRLMKNKAIGVTVIDFPEVLKHNLINKYRISSNLNDALENYRKSLVAHEIIKENDGEYEVLSLYDYQEYAIEEFKKYNYQHFYEMATGTGKTFT